MSELKVNRSPFEKTRHVVLKGEALFQVRRNGTPFIITTDIGTIQVLGTQFNVRVRDNKMEVAVLNGSVKVSVKRNGKDSSMVLSGGQIAVCIKNDFPGMPATLPFFEYPGWLHGKFMFYRSTLLSACKEIESQFDVAIKIEKPQLHGETITGIVDGQNVEASLITLSRLTGNRYRHEDSSYVIY
jgi:ferric-dicitrate binding protein FerR (iron transport regulator)